MCAHPCAQPRTVPNAHPAFARPILFATRWGNKLSSKFFLEKKFVVKHIYNKHPEKVDAAKLEVRRRQFLCSRAAAFATTWLRPNPLVPPILLVPAKEGHRMLCACARAARLPQL